jgi:adenylate cyclase
LGAVTTERRLAAILAADVVGFSRLVAADEPGTLARLRGLRSEVVEPNVAEHGGRIFKTTGDGLLAEFPSAVHALQCAIAIEDKLRRTEGGLQLRIGLHAADVVVQDGDLLGDGVNVAARLEPLAGPGGICISGRVREDAAGRLPLEVEDLGEPELKNIAQRHRVFRIRVGASERPAPALPDKPSLVVLPFQNMSGDPEQEYFTDGLVEDITTALSCIRSLFVIARNSAFTYKFRAVDVRQVARELGVRYVLEGSVRKAGSRLRISGQLVDAAVGAHLWANRFDGSLEDVFDLQDSVTASIAGALMPRLQRAEIERAQHKPTQDLGAYDYFLRGMAVFHRGERMLEAQALFARSYELDPGYGVAYAMAARCISVRRSNMSQAPSLAECAEGIRLARLGAAHGMDDSIALANAAAVLTNLDLDLESGALLTERACTLNPNSAVAWSRAGFVAMYLGDHRTAISNFERAIRLSPVDPERHIFLMGTGYALCLAGRPDDAVGFARRALSERPDYPPAVEVRTVAYAAAGRIDEARRSVQDLIRVAPQLRLSTLAGFMGPHRPEALTMWTESLRRAGLPE